MNKKTTKNPARRSTKRSPTERKSTTETAAKDGAAVAKARREAKSSRERDPRLPATGETITKAWRGKTLRVRCVENGFVLDGTTYRTLSAAAKAASGFASVNGYLFFGLVSRGPAAKKPPGKKASSNEDGIPKPKIGGKRKAIGVAAGQRAAREAAGITRRRRKPALSGDALRDVADAEPTAPEAK